MAPHPGSAVRPSLVALVPVGLLAAVGLVAVAVGPEARVVGLVALAGGTLLAVACGLALAGGSRRRLEGLARAAAAADAALDAAARALKEGRPVEAPAEAPGEARAAIGAVARSGDDTGAGGDAVTATAATLERLVATSTRLLAEEGGR